VIIEVIIETFRVEPLLFASTKEMILSFHSSVGSMKSSIVYASLSDIIYLASQAPNKNS
jgi:hypothetical protein